MMKVAAAAPAVGAALAVAGEIAGGARRAGAKGGAEAVVANCFARYGCPPGPKMFYTLCLIHFLLL